MSEKVARPAGTFGVWLLLTLLFIWPATLNQGPIWFFDSVAYLSAPAKAVAELTGWRLEAPQTAPAEPATPTGDEPDYAKQAGRSIYYGLVTFLAFQAFGPTAIAVEQAALFAAALMAALWPWLADPRKGALVVGLCLAVLTAVPFVTSYVMPDYLAGLTILAAGRLLVPVPGRGWGELALWWLLLLYALAAHTSHALIALALFVCAPGVLYGYRLPWPKRGVALACLGLVGAAALELLFVGVVERTYGTAPVRPPFVAARIIADGPGQEWLDANCPRADFVFCNYRDRLPLSAGEILWNRDPATGIWGAADPTARRRMSDEQYAFTLAVLADRPLAQLRASAARFGEQLSRFGIEYFTYSPGLRNKLAQVFGEGDFARIRDSALYQGTLPLHALTRLQQAVVLASLVVLAGAATRRWGGPARADEEARRFRAFVILVLLGILANAAITGILSAPAARYQARVIWLLPMLAVLVLLRRPRRAAFRIGGGGRMPGARAKNPV